MNHIFVQLSVDQDGRVSGRSIRVMRRGRGRGRGRGQEIYRFGARANPWRRYVALSRQLGLGRDLFLAKRAWHLVMKPEVIH